ncbi:MAG TPA: tetratricopeptide repeat protein [Thermoanaerobaculia bacterium]|nr:tetratricopeptide repeat protein [Thermoanaerobaculia bacterium]
MRPRPRQVAVLLFLVAALLPAALPAQPARLALTVENTAGEPVAGARIKLTTEERSDIQVEAQTNRRGKATVTVPSFTFVYDLVIEAEGYDRIATTIVPRLGQTTFRTLTLGAGPLTSSAGVEGGVQPSLPPAETAFNAGVEALAKGEIDAALAKFLEAHELDPELAVADSGLATVYLQQDRAEEALAAAQRFLESSPRSPQALRLVYEAHSRLGHAADAERVLKELATLEEDTDLPALLFNEGADAAAVGDLATAERRFLEALEVQPDLHQAVDALMVVYARRGEWRKAAERAEQMLERDPSNERALRVRYEAYREIGDAEKEKEALAALARVDSAALASAFLETGLAKFDAGDVAGAIVDLEKVVELAPDVASAHYYLGLCYTNTGEPTKAKARLERFVELAPNDPNAASAREMLRYLE